MICVVKSIVDVSGFVINSLWDVNVLVGSVLTKRR